MKIKIYKSYDGESIRTEEERRKEIEKDALERYEDGCDPFDLFAEEKHYYPFRLFSMNDEEKEEVKKEFFQWCQKEAEDYFDGLYEEIEKEV